MKKSKSAKTGKLVAYNYGSRNEGWVIPDTIDIVQSRSYKLSFGNFFEFFEQSIQNIVLEIRAYKMRNKSANSELVGKLEESTIKVLGNEINAVEQYLKKLENKQLLENAEDEELYYYTKKLLIEGLTPKCKEDPVFGMIIERIARLQILLNKFEKLIYRNNVLPKDIKVAMSELDYTKLITEFRKTAETFANLRWAADKGSNRKIIERLRETVYGIEEDEKS